MYKREIMMVDLSPEVLAWLEIVSKTTMCRREQIAAEIIGRAYAAAQEVKP